jgi:DNA-binding response OmpR family regulator
MLPGIDGFQVCEALRKEFPGIGIIMLTAKGQDMDKIMGLEYGADDYMIKPFNPLELVLRIKSLLRRMEGFNNERGSALKDGPFRIDTYSQKLFKNEINIDLTPTEYSIMKIFMENPGRALKRDDILNLVWGYGFVGDPKIVDVNIRRLRAKVEDNPGEPSFIETIWGTGYRWKSRKNI